MAYTDHKIIIGNSDYLNTEANGGGWNYSGAWGNSGADTFTFADQNFATSIANGAFMFNGAGGADSLSFAGWTAATFNLGQMDYTNGGSTQTWSILGTSLSDTFQWGGDTGFLPTSGQAMSLNGGSGTDTLQLLAGTNYHLANTNMTNIEWIVGTTGSENVFWTGVTDYTFDLAAGLDTLDISTSTSGKYLKMSGDSRYANIEAFIGSSLADSLSGSDNNTVTETLSGGAGKDLLWGAAGNDIMTGGKDSDTYYFGASDGMDSITVDTGNNATDVVYFRSGSTSDITEFAALSFNVSTTDKQSLVIGVGGTDSLWLQNWVNYSGTTASSGTNDKRVNTFVTSEGTFGLAVANDVGTSLFGTVASMNYYMQGGAGNDTIKAGAASADKISAKDGNDLMYYSSTASSFDGGGGTDTLSAINAELGVSIQLTSTVFSNVEFLQGSSVADLLGGSTNNENIVGAGGADSLWSNAGSDFMSGGAGADTYWFGVGDGSDTIGDSTASNLKSDVVNFFTSTFASLTFTRTNTDADVNIALYGTSDELILSGAGTQMSANTFNRINKFVTTDMTFGLAVGTAAGESLLGSTIADYIIGGDGADTINGNGGGDALYGQEGDDLILYNASAWIDGGTGTNTVTAAASTAGINVQLGTTTTKVTNVQYVLGSTYADQLGGTSAAETLSGGAGADSLWGAGGADILDGGNGADSYWFGGGDGADTIVSSTANSGDTVMFFGASITASMTTVVSGNNLTIGLTSGDSLTLVDWALDSAHKVNAFNLAGVGTYSLAVDSSNKATWTKIG